MANNFLGQIRRSQVLDYGPGAIIDFRSGPGGGGPVSVMSAGLEHWDISAQPPFPGNSQVISEPRLEKKLGVNGFRLPPVDDRDKPNESKKSWLIGIRFPYWLQCPNCNKLKSANKWDKEPGDPSRWCQACSSEDIRVYAIPTRFVSACENGHIDEFPWEWWLSRANHKKSCKRKQYVMKLENRGSIGLSGLFLICIECGAGIPMEGIFGQEVLKPLGCKGRMPWLGSITEDCTAVPRVLQRGASNLYMPVPESALSIPPWSDRLQEVIGIKWSDIVDAPNDVKRYLLKQFEKKLDKNVDDLLTEIDKRIEYINSPENEDLREDEYKNLIEDENHNELTDFPESEFEIRQQKIINSISSYYLERLTKVVRLREVRALKAFTRIYEPTSVTDSGRASFGRLSSKILNWLPAVEVRGEGVFISLNSERLNKWENDKKVCDRALSIDKYFQDDWNKAKGGNSDAPFSITPRFLLIHTLAHALMRYMSLECGYDTASIRERLFIKEKNPEMHGILLYTSSNDSEGTLGGLARQAEPDLFENILLGAIETINWCSSDPLCINGITSMSETFNIAACHACVMVPETSCELYNRFLDRAMLIGSITDGTPGFFKDI